MQEIKFEFETSISISDKGNQCIKLLIKGPLGEKEYFGMKAVHYICQNKHFFSKDYIKYIKGLKKMTDDFYLSKNK